MEDQERAKDTENDTTLHQGRACTDIPESTRRPFMQDTRRHHQNNTTTSNTGEPIICKMQ